VAERRSVAADVVGSKPTSRPNISDSQAAPARPLGYTLPPSPKTLQETTKQASLFSEAETQPTNLIVQSPIQLPAHIHAGTSGWAYPAWKPGFYPARLPAKRFLEHYATQLNSVEVNYTFRAFPTASMLAGWLAATPPGFRFSFKAPQRITHFSRLNDCDSIVADFVSVLDPLRQAGKLGVLLFQLPPTFKADPLRLAAFLAAPALNGSNAPALAFEFRHQSWFTEEIYSILGARDAALCIAESDDLQTPEIFCSSTHICFRLRRTTGYSAAEVAAFAEKFSALAATRDVYIYFKHEDDPAGALNAVELLHACAALAGKR
jgi:uncharacterized protein YecE (DUF72 family)